MNPFVANLKHQAEQNPLAAVALGLTAVAVVTKWATAMTEMRNANVWAKEVARRSMKDALK